jgi:hypothetical protein
MVHRIICSAQWIGLISVFLAFPAAASAQGDGMIIIAACIKELHKVADFPLEFSAAQGTNIPGNERVRPLGFKFGATINGPNSIGFDMDLAVQTGKTARTHEDFGMFEYLFGPQFNKRTGRGRRFSVMSLSAGYIIGRKAPGIRSPLTKATVSLWLMAAALILTRIIGLPFV